MLTSPFGRDSGGIIHLNINYDEDVGVYMSEDAGAMEFGVLWRGEQEQRVFDIVSDALKHYILKYGASPDIVYLNREMLRAANQENRERYLDARARPPARALTHFVFMDNKSEIVVDDSQQNGHIWIGVRR